MGLKESIVLISSGQPSANPRLVKEAVALSRTGYSVTVIYVPLSPWADSFDESLFKMYPQISFVKAGYHPEKQKRGYIWARARRQFLFKVFSYAGDIYNVADYSSILFGQELLKTAKKHKAELYIAHNLGALPVAVKVAEIYGAKVGFDAEDFHRGEVNSDSISKSLLELTEDKYFPRLDYFSTASPLTLERYKTLYPQILSLVINNVFEKKHRAVLMNRRNESETLDLLWFSQTIGKGRGLEDVIKAVCEDLKGEPITLTLIGNCSNAAGHYLQSLVPKDQFGYKISIKEPISPDCLFQEAANYHVGLALEPGRDTNNNLALSNKIFTYLLAGNAVIASDTDAQFEFLNSYPGMGLLYHKGDSKSLASAIKQYLNNPHLLAEHQSESLRLADTVLNWETESKKFLNTVAKVLAT